MNMQTAIIEAVIEELEKAKAKFPLWPTDPIHAATIVGEEAGELLKACLQSCYEPGKNVTTSDIVGEATQVAAMAIRFIERLAYYEHKPGEQK